MSVERVLEAYGIESVKTNERRLVNFYRWEVRPHYDGRWAVVALQNVARVR